MHFAGGLGRPGVDLHAAGANRIRRQGAAFKQPHGPQPFVETRGTSARSGIGHGRGNLFTGRAVNQRLNGFMPPKSGI